MAKHLQRDLAELKQKLLSVGRLVETATDKAILALVDRRPKLAQEVIEGDDVIDRLEVELEEDCLKVLALHQPVAVDLRFLVVVLKVNNDLERMGDLATSIAGRARYLAEHEPLHAPLGFPEMAGTVRQMVRQSLDALVEINTDLARQVLEQDDSVDQAHRRMFKFLQEQMKTAPATVDRAVHLMSSSRNLERIADLATNIAEDVVFMAEGEVIRHSFGSFRSREEEQGASQA